MHTPPLVLVADDEQDTAHLLRRICARAGYDVVIADNGIHAVQTAQDKLPDLLLLDIQMPGLNGFQVVERLRAEEATQKIPIIIITAAANKPEDVAHGIDLGADDFLLKPFNYSELMARMRAKIRAKELEENLKKRTQELEILVRLGADLTRSPSLDALSEQLLNFLNRELESSGSMVYILRSEDLPGVCQILHSEKDLTLPPEDLLKTFLTEFSAESGQHLLTAEQCQSLFPEAGIESGLVVPLSHNEEPLGLLAIGHTLPDQFGEDVIRVMLSVSQQVSLAVRNAQLFGALRAYADELEDRVEERTKALQSAQEQLMRSEKLASLGRLSGEIAHEINNPLQPIMTCLEGAIEDTENGDMVDLEDLQMAMSEVRRLKRTVTRLLDFARPDSSGVVSIDLYEIVEEGLALTHKRMQNTNIKLVRDLKSVPKLSANPDQLRQVFLNLTINAVDAMSTKGEGTLEVRLWNDERYAHLAVRDDGVGIAQDQITRIFEPFFSTKEYGSGLGLAISHSIIDAHGGKIDVKSDVQAGTEFIISLPLA